MLHGWKWKCRNNRRTLNATLSIREKGSLVGGVVPMKKAERRARAAICTARIEKYELEEQAMQAFFDECRSHMSPADWNRYYGEAARSAGRTFHIFEALIDALGETQLPITPRLKKAIDATLTACDLNHTFMGLQKLNYDKYWKKRYGYS